MSVFSFSSPLRQQGAPVLTRLRDGGTAALRPLASDEVEPLQAVFDGLSPASRTMRYLVGAPRLTGSMRRVLTAVDGHRHIAWLASVGDRPAGIARAVRVAPCTAEIAFEVVDEHQGRGVGIALLDAVTTVAAVTGIELLQASVLPSNHRSRLLLGRIGLHPRPADGLLEAEGPLRLLDPPRIDRPAVLRMTMASAASRETSEGLGSA